VTLWSPYFSDFDGDIGPPVSDEFYLLADFFFCEFNRNFPGVVDMGTPFLSNLYGAFGSVKLYYDYGNSADYGSLVASGDIFYSA